MKNRIIHVLKIIVQTKKITLKNFTKLENDKYNINGNSLSYQKITDKKNNDLITKKNPFIRETIKNEYKKIY